MHRDAPRPTPYPFARKPLTHEALSQEERSVLPTYWSGSTDVVGGPASRHGSLNSLFQVALYLPS